MSFLVVPDQFLQLPLQAKGDTEMHEPESSYTYEYLAVARGHIAASSDADAATSAISAAHDDLWEWDVLYTRKGEATGSRPDAIDKAVEQYVAMPGYTDTRQLREDGSPE